MDHIDQLRDLQSLREVFENPETIEVFEARSSQCTGQARLVRRLFGDRAQLLGFSNENNPGTIVDFPDEPEEGHHFAVIDDRFIVDTWMFGMSLDGRTDIARSVFDLDDAQDDSLVAACYGVRSTWVRLEAHEEAADRETLPEELSGSPRPRM